MNEALERARQFARVTEGFSAAGRRTEAMASARSAASAAAEALALAPEDAQSWRLLSVACWHFGAMTRAAAAARRSAPQAPPARSAVIAVLERETGIDALLADLADFAGEVIVVFNDPAVFDAMRSHPRIDKWAALSANAGVARAWNIGLNLAEGEIVFVLNSDLRVVPAVLGEIEKYFADLPAAAAIGIEGESIDPESFAVTAKHKLGAITAPVVVDKFSGYCFALHAGRCNDAGISFDPRFAPYFYEELDLMLKARRAGLETYAVPVDAKLIAHGTGISRRDRPIRFFGRLADRARVLAENAARIQARWVKSS